MRRIRTLALLLSAAPLAAQAEFIQGGRVVDPERDFSISVSVGQVQDISGKVEETTRRLYDLLGQPEQQAAAETYDLNELGLTESEITYGINLEKQWKYVTFRGDFSYVQIDASETAQRDYFIGVDEVRFNGKKYEYMEINRGTEYDASLDAAMIAMRAQITPFTLGADRVISFTPWVHFGLLAFVGTFEVDAGPATGVRPYENPPRDYVIGGQGEGDSGIVSPELGIGGELKFWFGETENGPIELVLQGTYAILEYEGSTDSLGISSRNEKDLDLSYDMTELRAIFYYPISRGLDFKIGGEYRVISADASSKAKIRSFEEAVTRREKFDKDIELEMTVVSLFAGLRF